MFSRPLFRSITLLWILLVSVHSSSAQTAAQKRSALRYEVDAKRLGVLPESDEALPASRSFLRIDSSYYVGWMYDGIYRATHAADYMGYQNAVAPLEKALLLLERDYAKELKLRTADLVAFYPTFTFKMDYSQTAYYLYTCYSNLEQMEEAHRLLRRAIKWNFQKDFYLDPFNNLAWIVHRNRFYNRNKYSFLRQNLDSNEWLAHRFLDSGLMRVERNKVMNEAIFGLGSDMSERLAVYHYKSILHSYAMKLDSAQHYYQLMRDQFNFPHNNFATLQMIMGHFDSAAAEYKIASEQESGDKRLEEWAYYSSLLYIYKSQPEGAIQLLQELIRNNGSTPGFGWYNIALARAAYYNGEIDAAERYLRKAENFNELHIGTSLGQSHYSFALNIQKLLHSKMKLALMKFEDKRWWLRPAKWLQWWQWQFEKWYRQLIVVQQLAQNPERDKVIYNIFSTENVVGWDELKMILEVLGNSFIQDKMQQHEQSDPREKIRKYFTLIRAGLQWDQGKEEEAQHILDNIELSSANKDNEVLFLARYWQSQALAARAQDDDQSYQHALGLFYKLYPQLLPASGMPMGLYLRVQNNFPQAIMKRLKKCNLRFEENKSKSIPEAIVGHQSNGSTKWITYMVKDGKGDVIVPQGRFSYQSEEKAAVQLAYSLFKVGYRNTDTVDKATP